MLNFIYWPVSWIMKMWYELFQLLGLGPQNAVTWILAVVFLVFTLRAILYWPAMKQIRTTRKMQELQPQIKALQKKYKNDRQRMAVEMQKLQKEHGFNPLLGCLPMLAQAPVFIGLYHVLRSFNRTGGYGRVVNVCENIPDPAECAAHNASIANYAFTPDDVNNFLHADLFGVPLSSYIAQGAEQFKGFFGFVAPPSHLQIAAVAIPLMIIAAIATHVNAKASVARQSPSAAGQSQAKIMNKLAVYVFPLGVLVFGAFLPIAILFYWVSNNSWTVVQQHYVYKRMAKEDEEKQERIEAARADRAPKPGAKPNQKRKGGARRSSAAAQVIEGEIVEDTGSQDGTSDDGTSDDGDEDGGADGATEAGAQAPAKPGPGSKPAAGKGGRNSKKNRAGGGTKPSGRQGGGQKASGGGGSAKQGSAQRGAAKQSPGKQGPGKQGPAGQGRKKQGQKNQRSAKPGQAKQQGQAKQTRPQQSGARNGKPGQGSPKKQAQAKQGSAKQRGGPAQGGGAQAGRQGAGKGSEKGAGKGSGGRGGSGAGGGKGRSGGAGTGGSKD